MNAGGDVVCGVVRLVFFFFPTLGAGLAGEMQRLLAVADWVRETCHTVGLGRLTLPTLSAHLRHAFCRENLT